MTPTLEIIPRAAWGAAKPRAVTRVAWPAGGVLWVHHSAGAAPGASRDAETAEVRAIQSFHQRPESQGGRAWSDIGYGYLIAPHSGRVYEGRGYGVMAAHCPGHNTEPSVCVMGKWDSTAPPQAALDAIYNLAHDLRCTGIRGHRDGFGTSCPGDALYAIVRRGLPGRALETPPGRPSPLPNGNTLRLVLDNGTRRQSYAGWEQTAGALRWIAKHGLRPSTRAAIAWDGAVWRGPEDVTNVARNLTRRFLTTKG